MRRNKWNTSLAGFWSKDEILGIAFVSFPAFWFVGFLTAGMTAFYMFRLYFLTFEGEFRGEDKDLQSKLLFASNINLEEIMKKKQKMSMVRYMSLHGQ